MKDIAIIIEDAAMQATIQSVSRGVVFATIKLRHFRMVSCAATFLDKIGDKD